MALLVFIFHQGISILPGDVHQWLNDKFSCIKKRLNLSRETPSAVLCCGRRNRPAWPTTWPLECDNTYLYKNLAKILANWFKPDVVNFLITSSLGIISVTSLEKITQSRGSQRPAPGASSSRALIHNFPSVGGVSDWLLAYLQGVWCISSLPSVRCISQHPSVTAHVSPFIRMALMAIVMLKFTD